MRKRHLGGIGGNCVVVGVSLKLNFSLRMVNYCRVLGCHNRSDREKNLHFYRLPKIILNQGEEHKQLSEERRRLWLARLNQNLMGKNLDNIRVCSAHFIKGKVSQYLCDFRDYRSPISSVTKFY